MNIVESIIKQGELHTAARLQCGHVVDFGPEVPHVPIGGRMNCPQCDRRRAASIFATDVQLDAIAQDYAETMRARGFLIGKPEEAAIRRSAAIQDAWRGAFKRIMGE